ncbi:anti sigma factor C-terminal domain-containing protein [Proteiniborus sp.]|uniref:anti sigma factor C-terminal domain-containing protein n=1 Tax=Proteiniborus sp. TaxID=2079015 RepID=UPI00332C8579
MDFKELLNLYKEGLVTEEEKHYIEREIEKYETIEEYLSEIMDKEFENLTKIAKAENHDEETIKLKKSVNNRLRKVMFASVAIVISLVITIFFIASPLVDTIYYNPKKITVGYSDSDISFDVYAISELNMPGLSPSTVLVDKKGFGEYNAMYSYRNVFTDESYNVNHRIKRGKIVSSNKDPILNRSIFLDIRYTDINETYIEEKKQNVINHLEKLNPVSYVSMEIIFENDLTMEELYNLELKYPDIEFEWAGIRTDSPDKKINEVIGIQLKNSKSGTALLGDEKHISVKYPAFFILGWLVNPVGFENDSPLEAQAYNHHYISLLEYVVDREAAVNVLEHRTGKYEFYKSALEYAKNQGVKTYGVLVFAEAEDLLEMIHQEGIKGLNLNQALVSKRNIN